MTIYRVEHFENGFGPHAFENRHRVRGLSHEDSATRPYPTWMLNQPNEVVRFGFQSLRQAGRWFPRHQMRRHLRQAGFVLVKLEVPSGAVFYRDRAQVAFDGKRARLIKCVGMAPVGGAA